MCSLKLVAYYCLISAFVVIIQGASNCREGPGYYWRDYSDEIPCDALIGGASDEGRFVYIGQVAHMTEYGPVLQPGQLDPEYKNVSYPWFGRAFTSKTFMKVLCTNQPQKLKWIPANRRNMTSIHKHFILAGYDVDEGTHYPVFVGRIRIDNKSIVGKITLYAPWVAFTYANDGKIYDPPSFEMLYYDDY